MKLSEVNSPDYGALRTRLYDLKFRLAVEGKTLSEQELIDIKQEITTIKKAMAHILQMLPLIDEESKIKGGRL